MKQNDREALRQWEEYKGNIARSTELDTQMSHAEIEKHRLWLAARPVEWIKFFFPGYTKYEYASFQK